MVWNKAKEFISKLRSNNEPEPSKPEVAQPPCCEPDSLVHIAYRGVSDYRLYVAYNRKWSELQFFKPRGLRAFCAKCRHRLY